VCENKNGVKLGIMIKALLKEHSLSMRKLSILTGIDTATISKILNGKHPANINHLQKFSKCLTVPIEQLLIAAGYELSNFKQKPNSNVEIVVHAIEEILKSSNLLEQQQLIERINEELSKYEHYALTEEGQEMILKGFDEKINKVSGIGQSIEELKQMYKQFCDNNLTTNQRDILGSGLLYFIFSTDIIPDYTYPIGYVDDFIAIKLVLNRLSQIKKSEQTEIPPVI